ncbi:hypothetical protein OH77DRAFT_1514381 [Trametes cingulata]|nr:hypothetical protein OH77DRAFT_1514381 [Trametes cingulata]
MGVPNHTIEEPRQGLSIVFTLSPPSVPGSAKDRYEWDVRRGKIQRHGASQPREAQDASASSSDLAEDASPAFVSPPESEGSTSDSDGDSLSETVQVREDEDETSSEGSQERGAIKVKVTEFGRPPVSSLNIRGGTSPSHRRPRGHANTLLHADRPLSPVYRERQGYTTELMIYPTAFGRAHEEVFALLIDTASNTSWVLGEDSQNLVSQKEEVHEYLPWEEHSRILHLQNRSVLKLPCLKHPVMELNDSLVSATVSYSDETAAHVFLPPGPSDLTADICTWQRPQRSIGQLTVRHRFGVALALTKRLIQDSSDGILALGRLSVEDAYGRATRGEGDQPTFLASLQNIIPRPHAERADDFALWLVIRPPHGVEPHSDEGHSSIINHPGVSFAAFHEWPCERFPTFSAPIALNPTVPYHGWWTVALRSLSFCDDSRSDTADGSSVFYKLDIGSVNERASLPVVLDAGASISRLPRRVFTEIVRNVVGDSSQVTDDMDHNHRPLNIPRTFRSRKIIIRYEFDGRDGTPVIVEAPATPFIYAANPKIEGLQEGLIFLQEKRKDHYAVFGLNWFQTMYVSLHKSKHSPDLDFVRLAPQWRDERRLYTLPPEFLMPRY